MTLRNYVLIGFSGLCIVTAVAGFSSEPKTGETLETVSVQPTEPNCMLEGIDTSEGRVGCFQPVIAVVDEDFFKRNAVVADNEAAE